MSLSGLLSQTGTLKHYTYTEDSRGNKVRVQPPTSTVYQCRLEQTDSQEISVGQQTVISNMRLFLPPDAVVDSEDQWTQDGVTYELVGPPATEHDLSGPHHVVAHLRASA